MRRWILVVTLILLGLIQAVLLCVLLYPLTEWPGWLGSLTLAYISLWPAQVYAAYQYAITGLLIWFAFGLSGYVMALLIHPTMRHTVWRMLAHFFLGPIIHRGPHDHDHMLDETDVLAYGLTTIVVFWMVMVVIFIDKVTQPPL